MGPIPGMDSGLDFWGPEANVGVWPSVHVLVRLLEELPIPSTVYTADVYTVHELCRIIHVVHSTVHSAYCIIYIQCSIVDTPPPVYHIPQLYIFNLLLFYIIKKNYGVRRI